MTAPIVLDRQLRPVAVLDAVSAMSWEKKHNDLCTASITLSRDDPCAAYCTALTWMHLWDGARDLGIYRISAISSEDGVDGGSSVYTLEHVLALLLDDVIFGTLEIAEKPFRQAIETLLDRQTDRRWVLGACEFDSTVSMSVSGETILGAIQSACGQLGEEYTWDWDTSALPFRLNIRHADETAGCGIHYGRNMIGLTCQTDVSALVTRLYLLGGAAQSGQVDITSLTEGGVPYIDADTIGAWGIKAAIYQDDDLLSPEQLLRRGREILEKNKNPQYTYTATALDLYAQTGLDWDLYEPGTQVMVTDDDHGVRFTARIVSVAKQDALDDPGSIVITIANEQRDELGTLTSMQQALQSVQDKSIAMRVASFVAQDKMAGMETQIQQSAAEILLRATWEAHNELGQRVASAETSISVQAEAATILSGRTTALENGLTETQAQVRVANDSIGMLVTKTESLDGRVTTAQSGIDMLAGNMKLYAKQDDLDEVSIRLDAAENSITGQAHLIELKASQGDLDKAVLRLNAAEGSITAQGEQIALKASQDGLDAAVLRLNAAEKSITAQAQLIELKVNSADLNTSIRLSGDGVDISGGVITLTGYVKAGELEAAIARIGALEATAITASTLSANIASLGNINVSGGLSANSMQAQYGTFTNATIGNAACRKSTLTIGEKSCDFFAPADATFNIADMEEYKAAVSAVSLTKGTPSAVYVAGTKSYSVSIPYSLSNGKSGTLSHIVSAQSVYDSGYTDGYNAACDAVTARGGIESITNPAQGYFTAKAWAAAYIDGRELDYKTYSKTSQFKQ